MTMPSTARSKLMKDTKSKTVINLGKLQETIIRQTDISEEEAFFEIIRDIHGLDIVMSLNNLGCYMLPNRSVLPTLNFTGLLQKLAKRKTMFDDAVKQRKFKKIFGFYGYKISEICSAMSLGQRRSETSFREI
jgi:hypothetical protein